MELILLSKNRGCLGHLRLTSWQVWFGLMGLMLLGCAGVFFGGFMVATHFGIANPANQIAAWRANIEEQKAELQATREEAMNNLDALALRLGQMNAHVVRLDALGQRLTQMADLEDGEFDFAVTPSLGGPEEILMRTDLDQVFGLVSALDGLDSQLVNRQQQLSVLEDFLLNRKLQYEVHPEGRPISSGYISSGFGNRTDPLTGRAAFHKGVDFAGREGTDVVAVASGVVIWSGDRHGYGEMVEVNHGNGYVTRYAHNAENFVVAGETVKRGEIIASMGTTGRTTGPNLHFEVLRNGRAVDPLTYMN